MATYTSNERDPTTPYDTSEQGSATSVSRGSVGGGGGGTVTYLMRAWGTVSLRYIHWVGSAPDDSGAPEVVTDPVLMTEIY